MEIKKPDFFLCFGIYECFLFSLILVILLILWLIRSLAHYKREHSITRYISSTLLFLLFKLSVSLSLSILYVVVFCLAQHKVKEASEHPVPMCGQGLSLHQHQECSGHQQVVPQSSSVLMLHSWRSIRSLNYRAQSYKTALTPTRPRPSDASHKPRNFWLIGYKSGVPGHLLGFY